MIYAYSRCLVLTACLFFAVSPVAMAAEQGPTRIGVAIVDLEQVRAKSSAYKNVVEQLRTYQNELNGELQKEEESLRQANMELARKRTLISPEAFNEERRKVEESQAKLRSSVQGKQREMQKMEAGALTALEASILEVIARISKDHGFNLILAKRGTVILATPQLEITDLVVTRLNEKLPTLNVKKPGK